MLSIGFPIGIPMAKNVGEIHRLENKTSSILKLVEVQTGKYLGEDDIVRIQDKYGRKKK